MSTFKIVLLGGSTVGKSALGVRFFLDKWIENTPATIGAAFMTREMIIGDKKIQVSIWDTSGAERYNSITPMYVRGSQAVIICYDLSREQSVEQATAAIHLVLQQEPRPLLFVVGCKRDLACQPYYAPEDLRMATSDKTVRFVSAKKGQGVQDLFNAVLESLVERGPVEVPPDIVNLDEPEIDDRRCYPQCLI